jgi:DNA helicase-2/ATP-dependent DNA helicase PcrA
MTRARERLFLTHARVRRHFGQDQYGSASRFLSEVPPELIEGFRADADEREMLGEYEADEDAGNDLTVGDWVEHDHFGRGRIVRLVGAGANARATVNFANYGEKQLLLAYAKLRLVGPDSAGGPRRSR